MDKKKLLVLGSKGFIGSHTCKQLQSKYNIIADRVYTTDLNLLDAQEIEELFNTLKPDYVLHAAAVTTGSKDVIERPYLHVTNNMVMNSQILEACYRHGVKHTIFLSCTVMYQPKDYPQKESDWKIEDEIYPAYFGVGNMKVFSEKLCEFYSRLPNAGKFTAIRHSNVYGPGDKFDLDKCHLVPAMVKKICDAKDTLEVWGQGKAKRDIIYIDDVVNFIDRCFEKQENQYELFNCGIETAYSIQEIINIIMTLTKKKLKIIYNFNKPDIPTTVILDCSKAKEKLGWTNQTDISDGLLNTINYYERHQN